MADANKHTTYSLADIERYLQGAMDAREMHDLERAALQDPFLADAIEGFSAADMQVSKMHLTDITSRFAESSKQAPVIAMPQQKRNQSWRIAAAVIVLAGIAGFGYLFFNNKNSEASLAKNVGATGKANDSAAFTNVAPFPADTAALENNTEKPVAANKKVLSQPESAAIAAINEQPTHQKTPLPAPSLAQPGKKTDSGGKDGSYAMAMRAPAVVLSGSVTDTKQQPVASATIMLADSTATLSDEKGRFSFTTTDSAATASVQAPGYAPASGIQLRRQGNNIVLEESSALQTEIVVTSIGKVHKKIADSTAVMPEGGWQSFQEYVYKRLNKKYNSTTLDNASINGELNLEFSIDKQGQPYNFTVLHAHDNVIANEAIKAIKQGPKWIGANKGKKTTVTVKY